MFLAGPAITRRNEYRELDPLPAGCHALESIAARSPLCATFPTGRGDKLTDAVLPPRLSLLRDSKSFVKRISAIAKNALFLAYFLTAVGHATVHRLPTLVLHFVPRLGLSC